MNLRDAVQSLGAMEIEALDCITIAPRNGEIVAVFSISLNLPQGHSPALPEKIEFSGFERWPDPERVIDWQIPLPVQIEELRANLALGILDVFQLGEESWRIKTHAGSDAERREWVMRR